MPENHRQFERDRWDELYAILVKARKGDGVSIGTLQVVA
jgi:hypothetical protein